MPPRLLFLAAREGSRNGLVVWLILLAAASSVAVVTVSGGCWAPSPAHRPSHRRGISATAAVRNRDQQAHRPRSSCTRRIGATLGAATTSTAPISRSTLLLRTHRHKSRSRHGISSSSSSWDDAGDPAPVATTTDSILVTSSADDVPRPAGAVGGDGGGALSRTVDELAVELGGGRGRARLVWDSYCIGLDPAYAGGVPENNDDDDESAENIRARRLLPSARRTQRLGQEAQQLLAQLHQRYCHGVTCVDGGVAKLVHQQTSRDGTTKLLLQLHDQTMVETVIIPWNGTRSTLCISSQVGCRQGCKFCATGKMGKVRSLSADEILAQMFFARQLCRRHPEVLPPVTNVVFMGMGEPSDNAAAVVKAVQQLTARSLFQLSASKVTVSTVAPTPDAFDLFRDAPCVLAWSVHAARDELRRQLVPTTRYTMQELQQGLVRTLQHRPRHLRTTMLEVTLLDQINDSIREAEELAELALGIAQAVPDCKLMVNLIPYNEIFDGPGNSSNYRPPTRERVRQFQQHLWNAGVYAHVRVTRGDDANAACGQLVTQKRAKARENVNR